MVVCGFYAWLQTGILYFRFLCQGLYKYRRRAQLHSSSCIRLIYAESLLLWSHLITTVQAPAQEPVSLSSGQQPGVEMLTMEQPTVGGEGTTGETRQSQNGEHTFLV